MYLFQNFIIYTYNVKITNVIFYLFISEQSSNLSVHFTLISHLATFQVLKTVCAFVTILDNADLEFFFPILTYWFREAVRSIAQKTLVHSSNLACGPDFVWARGWVVFIFKRLLVKIQRNVWSRAYVACTSKILTIWLSRETLWQTLVWSNSGLFICSVNIFVFLCFFDASS